MTEDKTLTCKDCRQQFSFTVGEQEFYAQKGFQNEPARCAPCRQVRKRERTGTSNVRFREQPPAFGNTSLRSGYDRP